MFFHANDFCSGFCNNFGLSSPKEVHNLFYYDDNNRD
jgi:hypothetical protein